MRTAVPLNYIARNLYTRKLTTLLTVSGMALVVFVLAAVLMMAEGLRQTLVATGSSDNVTLLQRGADTEVQSTIDRVQKAIAMTLPGIALDEYGQALLSAEPIILVTLRKRANAKAANVIVRGVAANGLALRPQVRIREGRALRPGSDEVLVGRSIAAGFDNSSIGRRLRLGQREWIVVGVFDAGGSAFDSEIWGDAEQLMQTFRRATFSSITLRLRDAGQLAALSAVLVKDVRLRLSAQRETAFFAAQSEQMASFIGTLGTSITAVFSLGAMIGAMVTMYATVANRTREIGTLRALGFTRRSTMYAFLIEAVLLGIVGGLLGLCAAAGMQWVRITTTNFQTFADIEFGFHLTRGIAAQVLLFGAVMGAIGGFLPAARAARMTIVDALRAR